MKLIRLTRFCGASLASLSLFFPAVLATKYSSDGNGAVPSSGNFNVANNWQPSTAPCSGYADLTEPRMLAAPGRAGLSGPAST